MPWQIPIEHIKQKVADVISIYLSIYLSILDVISICSSLPAAFVRMRSGICQGMSWQHLHQPCVCWIVTITLSLSLSLSDM